MENENNKIRKWINKALIKNTYFQGIIVLGFAASGGMWIQANIIDEHSPKEEIEEIDPIAKKNNLAQDKCDSNFLDDKWKLDSWWEKDGQIFTYNPEQNHGPKMTFYDKKLADNFTSTFEFVPVENIDNKNREINLVVYVGDLYKIVFEKVYEKKWKDELESSDSFYVAYTKDDKKVLEDVTGAEIINLEHEIRFDNPINVFISQSIKESSSIVNVEINFKYSPEKNPNTEKIETRIYKFSINNGTSYNNEKEISLGLIYSKKSKAIIITKFNCFKLENR